MAEDTNDSQSVPLQDAQNVPVTPVTPVTPLGDKLQQYQQDRFKAQTEAAQPSGALPIFKNTEADDIISNFQLSMGNHNVSESAKSGAFAFSAGPKTGDFDRFYAHPLFKKLGFDPFRDNEAAYNEQSTPWQEFSRGMSQWAGLVSLGAKDMVQEIADPFSLSADKVNAADMNRRMEIGSSSKGGVTGQLTNFALNTGYTIGIIAEMGAEELGMASLDVLSEGRLSDKLFPRMASRFNQSAKDIEEGGKAIAEIENFSKAKDLFGQSRVSKFAQHMLPFEHSSAAIKDIMGGVKMTEQGEKALTTFAKAKMSAGALWRDAREIRAVTSESRLEGGTTYNDTRQDLLNHFYEEHGRAPESDEEMKDIESRAVNAARADILGNVGLIYATNKFALETALKGFTPLEKSAKQAITEISWRVIDKPGAKLGEDIAEKVGKYSMKGIKDALRPVNIAKHGMKYLAANFAEGLQEIGQDAMSTAAKDYYEQPEIDPSVQGHKGWMASISKGVDSQLSSQGLETFASGFFMGTAIQGPQHLIFNTLPAKTGVLQDATKAFFTKNTYKDLAARRAFETTLYKKQQEIFADDLVNSRNEISKRPFLVARAIDRNFMAQREAKIYDDKYKIDNDPKSSRDNQQDAMFHNIYTTLQSGREDILRDHLKALKQMDDKSLADAMEMPNATPEEQKQLRKNLDKYEDKIDDLKKRYDYFDENFQNHFKFGTPEYHALDFAKKLGTFASHDFDNTLSRMKSVADNLANNKPISKANFNDFKLLFHEDDLKREMKTLTEEIKTFKLGTDSESKQNLKKAEEKLEAIKNMNGAIKAYSSILHSITAPKENTAGVRHEDPILTESTNDLFKHYKAYVELLGKHHGETVLNDTVAKSFVGLKDYYALKKDNGVAAKAINILTDPGFVEHHFDNLKNGIEEAQKTIEDKQKEALKQFLERPVNNDFINGLRNIGVYLSPEDTDALINEQTEPINFLDSTTFKPVEATSNKMKKILDLLDIRRNSLPSVKPKPFSTPTPVQLPDSQIVTTRKKTSTDLRTYEQIQKQFEFTNNKSLPTQEVLKKIITSIHSTPAEKQLAQRLLTLTSPNSSILFKESGKAGETVELKPSSGIAFPERTFQTVIDARYSSSDYKGGNQPLEVVILHEILSRIVQESFYEDVEFKEEISKIADIFKTDPDELLENILNSHEIQEGLKKENLWEPFAEAVRDLIGRTLGTADPKVLDEAITLLNSALPPGVKPKNALVITTATFDSLPQGLQTTLINDFRNWNSSVAEDLRIDLTGLNSEQISKLLSFVNVFMKSSMAEATIKGYVAPDANLDGLGQGNKLITQEKDLGAHKVDAIFVKDTAVVPHAIDTATAQGLENGQKPTDLTSEGVDEAKKIGVYAQSTGKTLIEHSPVQRATQTAKIAADYAGVETQVNPNLATWNIGEFDGKTDGSFDEAYWIKNHDQKVPGGESFDEYSARMEDAFRDADLASSTTMMIAHSKVVRALKALKVTNGKWTEDTTKLFLQFAENKVHAEVHEDYHGKLVYASGGTGKSTFALDQKNVTDGDKIIIEVLRQHPDNQYKTDAELLEQRPTPEELNKIMAKFNELKQQGHIVLIGSTKYMNNVDKVLVSKNQNLLMNEKFDDPSKYREFKNQELDAIDDANKIDDITFFDNYVDEVLAKESETKNLIMNKLIPSKSLQEKFDAVNDIVEYIELMEKELENLRTSDTSGLLNGSIEYDMLVKLATETQNRLKSTPTLENLTTGKIVTLNLKTTGDKKFFVVSVTGDKIIVQSVKDPNNSRDKVSIKTVTLKDIAYLSAYEAPEYLEMLKEEQDLVDQSNANAQKTSQEDPAVTDAILNSEKPKNKMDIFNDVDPEDNCK